MARPPKKGLSYFPMDVGFFENDRVFALADRCGVKGIAVYLALLVTVYREGYYIEAPVERVAAMIMRSVGARSFSGQQEVVEIMTACADIGLLDRELFRQGVITSQGIQCRYAEITTRRAAKPDRYWLLNSPAPEESATASSDKIPIPTTEPAIPTVKTSIPTTEPAIPTAKTSIPPTEPAIPTAKTQISADKTPPNHPKTSPEANQPISAAKTPAPAEKTLPPKPPEAAVPETRKAVSEVKTQVSAAKTPVSDAETPVSANRNATNQIKENQIKQNQTKQNEIKSDQIKSSRTVSSAEGIRDDGMDRIRKEFESIKILTPADCRVMADLRRIYGLERVLDAISRARSWGGKSVSYVRQILANDQNRTPSSFMSVSSAESRAAALRAAACAGGEIFSGMELIGRPISEEDAVLDADWLSDLTPEEAEAFFERK